VIVLPSVREQFGPGSWSMAMACGLPAIAVECLRPG
jgi:hypothetical protein